MKVRVGRHTGRAIVSEDGTKLVLLMQPGYEYLSKYISDMINEQHHRIDPIRGFQDKIRTYDDPDMKDETKLRLLAKEGVSIYRVELNGVIWSVGDVTNHGIINRIFCNGYQNWILAFIMDGMGTGNIDKVKKIEGAYVCPECKGYGDDQTSEQYLVCQLCKGIGYVTARDITI